jgi:hypothetical protein
MIIAYSFAVVMAPGAPRWMRAARPRVIPAMLLAGLHRAGTAAAWGAAVPMPVL